MQQITSWYGDATFRNGATVALIAGCAGVLGHQVPGDLADLLCESDGVDDEYGCAIVWPVQRIIADNLHFAVTRSSPICICLFDPMLFFGDAGNGDQFAFVMRNRPTDVFVWDHETDSRTMIAGSLAGFLEGWLTGRITV